MVIEREYVLHESTIKSPWSGNAPSARLTLIGQDEDCQHEQQTLTFTGNGIVRQISDQMEPGDRLILTVRRVD